MTFAEATIFVSLVFLIVTNIIKILKDKNSADVFGKLLNKVALVQEIHATKLRRVEEDQATLRHRVDNHDDEFSNVREQIREIPGA